MSQTVTLQADLTVTCNRPGGPRMTVPSGTVVTFPDASAGVSTGKRVVAGIATDTHFATALCAAAEMLREIGGRAALAANVSEFDNQTVDGVTYLVSFGPDGQAIFDSQGVSASASPSSSRSASASSTPSASPSSSVSSSGSASPSSSRSASPSASA